MRCYTIRISCLVIWLAAAACGSSSGPTTPSPPSPPVPPPTVVPPAPNLPPTIKLVASSNRVEADNRIDLTADVEDAETPLDQLTYEWTSDKGTGTFIGAGRQVKWQAPHLRPTPDTYILTLTVIERYEFQGETKENRTSASVTVIYNDSYREIREAVETFLRDFSTYATSPDACVRNFSGSCPGKDEELSEIRENRRVYTIKSGSFSIDSITVNSDSTFATTVATCQFVSTINATGKTETATGKCILTSVYDTDKWKWFLCDSFFHGSSTLSLKALGALVP